MSKSPIKRFYAHAMNYIGLTFLFFIVSFLGVLIPLGAALSAAFYTSFKLRDTSAAVPLIKTFMQGLKKTFIPATLMFLVSAVLMYGLFVIYTFASRENGFIFVQAGAIFSAFYLLMFNLYAYPVIATFNHKGPLHFVKNTFIMMHIHPFVTIKLLGSLSLVIALFILVHESTIIIGVALYFFLQAFHLSAIFDRYLLNIE